MRKLNMMMMMLSWSGFSDNLESSDGGSVSRGRARGSGYVDGEVGSVKLMRIEGRFLGRISIVERPRRGVAVDGSGWKLKSFSCSGQSGWAERRMLCNEIAKES